MTSSRTDERGSVTVLVAAAMCALLTIMPLALQVGSLVVVHRRVQVAADLAALAAAGQLDVGDPCATADAVAAANSALVTNCEIDARTVTVAVRSASSALGVTPSARARAGLD